MGHAPVVAELVHLDAGVFVVATLVHAIPTVDVGVGGPTAVLVAPLKDVQDVAVASGQGKAQFVLDGRGDGVANGTPTISLQCHTDGDFDYAWSGVVVVTSSLGDTELVVRAGRSLGFEINEVGFCITGTEDVVANLASAFRTSLADRVSDFNDEIFHRVIAGSLMAAKATALTRLAVLGPTECLAVAVAVARDDNLFRRNIGVGIEVGGRTTHEVAAVQSLQHFLLLGLVEVETHNLVGLAVRGVLGVELALEFLLGSVLVGAALQTADAGAALVVARDLEFGNGHDGAGFLHLAVGIAFALERTKVGLLHKDTIGTKRDE